MNISGISAGRERFMTYTNMIPNTILAATDSRKLLVVIVNIPAKGLIASMSVLVR